MSKWTIDKQFSFCYGHRVWSQKLNTNYCETGDTQCKCRHLHGHEGLVHVFLDGESLERGMVTDFKHLGWSKNFLDNVLDHKFIIDKNDPMFDNLVVYNWSKLNPGVELVYDPIYIPGTSIKVAEKISTLINGCIGEVLEGYTIVDFVPTSENFCKWLFDITEHKMSLIDIKVSRVDWFETPKSRSSYSK